MHDHLPIGCGEVRFSSLKSEKLVAIKEKKIKLFSLILNLDVSLIITLFYKSVCTSIQLYIFNVTTPLSTIK